MKISELKDLVKNSDSPELEPLRNLSGFMDYMNEEGKQE